MSETQKILDVAMIAGLREHVVASLQWHVRTAVRERAAQYAVGLVGPTERKSVEPMLRAQLGGVDRTKERRMTESLTDADWTHRPAMFAGAARMLEQAGPAHGMKAYVLDDTALVKQGSHSVGVANQYAGCLGGLANCQAIVTLAMTGDVVHTFVGMELFMPEAWFDDDHAKLRDECRVPAKLVHRTKQYIGISMLLAALNSDLPKLPLLMDSAYGDDAALRAQLRRNDLEYVAMVSSTKFFPIDTCFEPAPTKSQGATGRPSTRLRARVDGAVATSLTYKEIGALLPADAWQTLTWRIGSKGPQTSRFAAVRARPSRGLKSGTIRSDELQAEEWLLLHWPEGEPAPTRAWLSAMPEDTPIECLVQLARLRWGIERAHQEGKGDVGLDHYEGRTYPGLHHHLALVTLTHQYLAMTQLVTGSASSSTPFPPGGPASAAA